MNMPELLAPAGNPEKLNVALHYGADAVYLGLSDFSLRAKANNFSADELKQAIALVHEKRKKCYVTLNIFPYNRDINALKDHIIYLEQIKPDGVIVSDPGVFEMVTDLAPHLPLHVSTQANITNYRAAKFWERLGAKRLILSRELSIDEIKEIREKVDLELECFVHGAICLSYSGRCYMSSFFANRSANTGECTNSCRWNYTLMEEKRPGEYLPVYENDKGTFLLSSKDLCMIEHLDKLADAGVNSFKLEGRMKGINYVAGVVKTYRAAVNALRERPCRFDKYWLRELTMISNRGYTTGMFLGKQPDSDYNHDEGDVYRQTHDFIGIVVSVSSGKAVIALRNNLRIGDHVTFLTNGSDEKQFEIKEMNNQNGIPIDRGRNGENVTIKAQPEVRANDLVRRPHVAMKT